MRLLLVLFAVWLAFYLFTPWQALVLIGIAVLIVAVLYSTGHWKPVRQFEFDATAKESKSEARLRWTGIPAKHLFKRDLAVFSSLAEYHSVYDYKVDGERVSIRLVESTIEPAGKPVLYRVRDGVVGTSWIADFYTAVPELGEGEVEEFNSDIQWHDAPAGIRYFILKHTSGHREFLASERRRLVRAFSYVDDGITRLGVRQDDQGRYICPDGTESEAVETLLSDDNLSKYGISSDEFYRRELLLRLLPRF